MARRAEQARSVRFGIGAALVVSLLGNPQAGQGVCVIPSFSVPPAAPNFAVGSFPRSVAVGDFNADGTPDLAVANFFSFKAAVAVGRVSSR